MPTIRLKSVFARALLPLCGLAGATASQAAIYTGAWDPLYGPPLTSLGWSAKAVFDVPDACLALADGTYSTGPCSAFSFLSANVSFYNAFDPTQTPLETFQVANVANVQGIVTIAGNQVSSVASSAFFASFLPTSTGAAASIDGGGTYSFSLDMLAGKQAQLYYGPRSGVTPGCLGEDSDGSCGRSLGTAVGVFAPVPEPGTVTLLLAGLAGLAFAGRPRRGAPAPLAGS